MKQPVCLDLTSAEFHLVLSEIDAPADGKRWSIDLKDGVMHVRTWNDAMSNCHTIAITRTGCVPRVIEPHT